MAEMSLSSTKLHIGEEMSQYHMVFLLLYISPTICSKVVKAELLPIKILGQQSKEFICKRTKSQPLFSDASMRREAAIGNGELQMFKTHLPSSNLARVAEAGK